MVRRAGVKHEACKKTAGARITSSPRFLLPFLLLSSCAAVRGAFSLLEGERDPSEWPGCDDAYHVTWSLDVGDHLRGLSATNFAKLSRSMGYCPHRRCQLSDVGNSARPGQCPEGLCYTKLEKGSPTYGACCFQEDGQRGREGGREGARKGGREGRT
ncbi:hypothetical protein NSK_006854 [Nannochloropsis salina CCMP1776]|uniref:Uncharacterized protein n=1 Tax=Nannochloropsis salina CCMP1776 TaxID=1027361 RepID=A0A4D9CVT5_9STRA|nr:hypothetical protein NSK_006854 [Nannochloropsis salina CCMP1776]|eukprot:TFJ81603.1 hypothetical protein NSK_006854 [Nannochloropsis salina CCMP1776]